MNLTFKDGSKVDIAPVTLADAKGNIVFIEYDDGLTAKHNHNDVGQVTYTEYSNGKWTYYEYDDRGNQTYFEESIGFWVRYEFDDNGKMTYSENSFGDKFGTKQPEGGEMIIADIEKIEIIQSPQSSLYGPGAISNVINIFTKDGFPKGNPNEVFHLNIKSFIYPINLITFSSN